MLKAAREFQAEVKSIFGSDNEGAELADLAQNEGEEEEQVEDDPNQDVAQADMDLIQHVFFNDTVFQSKKLC